MDAQRMKFVAVGLELAFARAVGMDGAAVVWTCMVFEVIGFV